MDMLYVQPFRAKFPGGIVAEFLPPGRPSNRVVILCDGLPSTPGKRDILRLFSNNNFWCFYLRYRGTWESDGLFLKESPHKDIKILIDGLSAEFSDIWSGKRFTVKTPQRFIVIGSSFGGTAAILASLDTRIFKSVALAPVCDWKKRNQTEPLSYLKRIIRQGFGPVYRFSENGWKNLESGRTFNPASVANGFNSQKLLVIHAENDPIVPVSQSVTFCHEHDLRLVRLQKEGHLSLSRISHPRLWQKIANFLNMPTSPSPRKKRRQVA